MYRFPSVFLVPVLFVLNACAAARTEPAPRPARQQTVAGQDTTARGAPGARGRQPRPYRAVITERAVTKPGLITVHRVGDTLYFEIPRRVLGAELLMVARRVEWTNQAGFFGGGRNSVVVWERRGDKLYLREQRYSVAADSGDAIRWAVWGMQKGPIIGAFDVAAYGPDSAAVVAVTELFTSANPEMGSLGNVDRTRSFIEHFAAFERNVEVEAVQTGSSRPPNAAPNTPPAAETARIHWSFLLLPERPMMPRLHDRRVGFISIQTTDYSRPAHRAEERRYIRRFRLEKRDPNAALSEPVQPIVYWIDPATPDWLKPWVKKGVEAWNTAFRDAGFLDAIQARYAPTAEDDPDWSLYDARHSVIYWRPSPVQNATGGQVVDPRTGEILKGEVNMYHNVMNLLRNWYVVQVGPLDPRAQRLPLPDSLMGRLVEYVVTHEIGHSIGFPHNMKASAMYPADSVRSAAFLRRMGGHVATLMDYSRFNYVAQPEDSIPVELLVPRVGPYDKFAVMWGYKPIPGARTPDDEWPTLDQWSRMQDTIPWFRFTTADAPNDPAAQTEAVGDADPVHSSTLALRNLRRVMGMLIPVAERPGEDYETLSELYGNVVQQWSRYMGHVAALIGGAETQERYGTGPRFTPVSRARQLEAMRFLEAQAFTTPEFLIDREVLRRMEAEGAVRRIAEAHGRILRTLLNPRRLERLVEYESLDQHPQEAYTLADLMGDLRRAVWGELGARSVRINVYRRNLQRAYLATVDTLLNPPEPRPGTQGPPGAEPPRPLDSDVRPILRGELIELQSAIDRAVGRAADGMTRLHLRDARAEIDRILNPRR